MDWDRQPHRGPGSGNIQDLEEVLRRLKNRYDFSKFPKGSIWWIGLIVVVILIGFTSYYTVDPQETAVVQRFGKFVRTADAGLHFKIPFGIETVRKVVTGRVLQREYGYRTIEPGIRSRFAEKWLTNPRKTVLLVGSRISCSRANPRLTSWIFSSGWTT